MSHLKVSEIYVSTQGESSYAGLPCVFVRLAGCPLRCSWCDTPAALTTKGAKKKTIQEVVEEVLSYGIRLVEVTGGEPLAQKECIPLLETLIKSGLDVLLETSGRFSLEHVPNAVRAIVDVKCPDSTEALNREYQNKILESLRHLDHVEIKMVIASRTDYEFAKKFLPYLDSKNIKEILFSCAWGLISPSSLVSWVLEDKLPVRVQLQQHKYIWGPEVSGV